MCGITGIIDPRIRDKEAVIKHMADAIAHRGPDDDGFYVDEQIALGMRRLAIIDLEHGRQPITSTDERYLIFFNGEIYNYLELRKELESVGAESDAYHFQTESDTEVILAGYLKWGEALFPKLRGMFTFAIYDTLEQKLLLARDPFGIKPLYLFRVGNEIKAFSSEIKSFLSLPNFTAEVNDAAVYNYLSFQYNPLAETFFKNVFKLLPGHSLILNLKNGRFEESRYWQFAFDQDPTLHEGEMKKEIRKTMEDSVAHHMIADVPVGSFLSGGIDSSIIATLMQRIRGEKKIKTFTVGFESLTEGKEAKETAEPLGTDHTEIKVSAEEYFKVLQKAVWHFDEPVGDPSAIGIYFLAREARKSVKVVLSGEGADELFGGYNIYLAPLAKAKMAWMPKFVLSLFINLPFEYFGKNYLRRVSMKLQDWYFGQKYFNESVFQQDEINQLWRGTPISRFSLDNLYQEAKGLSDSTKMQYIDINTWLVGDILAKADKMTMAHSLELRVPFLDSSVASLASKLPDRFKWRNGQTKYLLREAFKNVLPESTRKRRKLGFPVPMAKWLNQEHFEQILSNHYIQKHLDLVEVKKLFAKPETNARKIYLLLILALWYDTFIHGYS